MSPMSPMSPMSEDPWPYLAFAALHLVAGQGLAGLIYRVRFGASPLVLYARRAASTEHGRRTRWVGLATLAWAAAFVAFGCSPRFRASMIGAPLVELPPLAGWILGVPALIGMLAAQIGMGPAFRVGLDPRAAPALVSTGLHRRSRNPIYLFSMLYLGALSLWAPCPAVIVALFAVAAGIHALVKTEERFLAASLGPAFAAYCQRVRRYL